MAKEEQILPAPKSGPVLSLRLRSKQELKQIKEAAKEAGLSINTWSVEVLRRAASVQ